MPNAVDYGNIGYVVVYRCYMKDKIYTLFLCAIWCFGVVFIGVIGVVYGN